MATRHALHFLASRALTTGCYALAIIGSTSWDRDPDSWRLTAFNLGSAVIFAWWSVARTIRHCHEDEEIDRRSKP